MIQRRCLNRKKSLNLKLHFPNIKRRLTSPNSGFVHVPEQTHFDQASSVFVHKSEQSAITYSLRTNSSMLTSAERFMGTNFRLLRGKMAIAEKVEKVKKNKPQRKRFKPILYLGLAPLFITLGLFSYYPAANGLTRAFFDWRFFEPSVFIGLENFRTMLGDDMWWETFKHIFIVFIAATTIMWALPLLAVEMLISIRSLRTQHILRTLLLFPLAFPVIVTIYMWGFIYHPNRGILNTALQAVGLDSLAQNWLGDPNTALYSLLFISFPWIASLPFFVFLTGLQNIGTEVFEAAAIDGCSRMKRFFLIDMPLLGRQFRLLFFLATISVLQFGTSGYVLTSGGPDNATMFPILRIIGVAFNGGDWGYAATLSSTLFILTLALSTVILFISRGEKQNVRSL